ncbi:MAG TPA: tRNA uridine-5-carboxymethylaminomethyl(34) synthesis enzyme MnmG, partial [Feifaniaceae bacterium]|nr:tRNA uridine-5-carboxymethylaminomethyl(34) synthesis enzyme MnmG [Feifaniaceae bacterium]
MAVSFDQIFDIVVIGAGHAGVEAALSSARMGQKTLILTLNLDSVGLMPCNPAIGGTGKGHLVREIDALGGEMGLAADETLIQMRMLNTGKGPAVHSLRAQMDKRRYHERVKRALESQPNLTLLQGEAKRFLTENGAICGVETAEGFVYGCRAAVVCTGVYLKSRILIGSFVRESGPAGLLRAEYLSGALAELGVPLQRFKTGTPARVNGRTLDYSEMERQDGDVPTPAFSFLHGRLSLEQTPCYLTYTNDETHRIIQENLHRSPMYSGLIHATGTRYCPSIEDKIVRFADKERHQIFIEPEGRTTSEMYVQGMSTSLPGDVQVQMLRTLPGLRHCEVMRLGYAIEYDCIDPTALERTLGVRSVPGLYTAGQINGTSGYEEAAAQGLLAGINAALYCKNEEPLTLGRNEAYLGVLVDDLSVKGTPEPYRMMTSRCEYRLLLRQDNADERLTEKARRTGLISDERYDRLTQKRERLQKALASLDKTVPPNEALRALLEEKGESVPGSGVRLFDLLKRQNIAYTDLLGVFEALEPLDWEAEERVETLARYDGYIQKQQEQVRRNRALEETPLPQDVDYMVLEGLRIEARQKLNKHRPASIGMASRISGVTPADVLS